MSDSRNCGKIFARDTKGVLSRKEVIVVIAVETLLMLLGGIVLAIVVIQTFGRGPARATPAVRLVRKVRPTEGIEETQLLINDQVILTASSANVRLADYADEVERLETVATRIAGALGVNVELARLGGRVSDDSAGMPMRALPKEAGTAATGDPAGADTN